MKRSELSLSRRARLYLLRQLALSALAKYGLAGARLRFLQFNENAIYRVDAPGAPAPAPAESVPAHCLPGRYVLRIHAMGDAEAVCAELAWLAALNRAGGLPAPEPVAALDGELLETIVTPGFPNGRVVTLLRWLDGRRVRHGWRPRHLEALGEALARLHAFSAAWQPPAGFWRFTWDWEALLGASGFVHAREELVAAMPERFQDPFMRVSEQARQAMQSLGKGPAAFGLVHGDLYPENVLFKGDRAYPIDFEDCGFGYWIWDIAVARCTWAWKEGWEEMRDAFREGYTRQRELPAEQWALLDLMIAMHFAAMTLWASEFLKNDPARAAEYTPWRDSNGDRLLEYCEGGRRA